MKQLFFFNISVLISNFVPWIRVLYHNSHFVYKREWISIRKLSYGIYVYNQDMPTTEEVDMMFPLNLDYNFLDNCAQSFGWIEGNLSGISFRKTNTKIDVGESKS